MPIFPHRTELGAQLVDVLVMREFSKEAQISHVLRQLELRHIGNNSTSKVFGITFLKGCF